MSKLILVGFLFVLFAVVDAEACLCAEDTPVEHQIRELKRSSDSIFIGKVVSVNKVMLNGRSSFMAEFDLESSWKGESEKAVVFTDGGCAVHFEEGGRCLVYAKINDRSELYTTVCMRSGPVELSEIDLQTLGEPKIRFDVSNQGIKPRIGFLRRKYGRFCLESNRQSFLPREIRRRTDRQPDDLEAGVHIRSLREPQL